MRTVGQERHVFQRGESFAHARVPGPSRGLPHQAVGTRIARVANLCVLQLTTGLPPRVSPPTDNPHTILTHTNHHSRPRTCTAQPTYGPPSLYCPSKTYRSRMRSSYPHPPHVEASSSLPYVAAWYMPNSNAVADVLSGVPTHGASKSQPLGTLGRTPHRPCDTEALRKYSLRAMARTPSQERWLSPLSSSSWLTGCVQKSRPRMMYPASAWVSGCVCVIGCADNHHDNSHALLYCAKAGQVGNPMRSSGQGTTM